MKYKHVAVFCCLVILLSIGTGFIYGINNFYDLKDFILNIKDNNILFTKDIIILLLFFFSTVSLLGIVVQTIYISIESLSIGYIIAEFYLNYKFKGVLFSLVYLLIDKIIFIIILLYLFFVSYKYFIKVIKNILNYSNDYIGVEIKRLIKKYILIFIFVMVIDLLIYFVSNRILELVSNVL